jgi:hypothetical protein
MKAQIWGTKNDEGHNGTICNANSGTSSQTYYKDTMDDNSTWDTFKGTKVGGTTNDISTRETTEQIELGS